jgi:AraC family transcriptional regulator, positive regulator of tynA and feaB
MAEMPVLAFDMNTANVASRRLEFRGKNNADYYDGELKPLSTREVDMKIEKSVAGDFLIYQLVSKSGLAFRRSWPHIRNDKTNVTVFWFVRHGHITVSCPSGKYTISPGECAITRSSRPFYMELTTDESGYLEAMHVVVSSHKLQSIISESLEVGRPFPTASGDLLLAERIFTLLYEEGDTVDPDIAEQLVETLLKGAGRTISRISGVAAERCSIADKRVGDITRYIRQHFANPDLNARKVATSCGISLRYLCHILKKNDLSFSTLVWDARMETAHAWLTDPRMQHHSICEIAYMVGFKSSAHFSRMFKARYGVAPREFRSHPVQAAA